MISWIFWELISPTFSFAISAIKSVSQFIFWIFFCGLPAMIVYIFHCLLVCPRFIRQIKNKTKDDLDTPLFTLTELLMFWPALVFSH